jgi:hypothetical protein
MVGRVRTCQPTIFVFYVFSGHMGIEWRMITTCDCLVAFVIFTKNKKGKKKKNMTLMLPPT